MKVENVATGQMVRMPRKLKKEIKGLGWTISGYSTRSYCKTVWVNQIREWFPIYAIRR